MSLRYEVLGTDEAFQMGLTAIKPVFPGLAVFRVEDGKYFYLGDDAGEVEDRNFSRDFGWVLSELAYAYEAGVASTKPSTKIAAPTNEVQAEIRKRALDFEARRAGATTPEARAKYKRLLNQIRDECKHPSTTKTNISVNCNDCGRSI